MMEKYGVSKDVNPPTTEQTDEIHKLARQKGIDLAIIPKSSEAAAEMIESLLEEEDK